MERPQRETSVFPEQSDISESKDARGIPHCRTEFDLDEAFKFIDEVTNLLHDLSDLHSLTALYRVSRQLNRTFTMCQEHRTELAKYMCERGLPRIVTRIIKRLNQIGVFSNDGTWFASFYLYSILWNYTDIDQHFSTSLGVTAISRLLSLNIGHPPYLANINSKNVYFLVKASLSILHNIIKIPGNRTLGQYIAGRDALLSLLKLDGEDTLRCIAVLCLAHLLNEDEITLAYPRETDQPNLMQRLLNHLCSASTSVKRKHHGFPMIDFLTGLQVFAVNESVQASILSLDVEKLPKPGKPQSATFQPINCLKFLMKLTDTYLSPQSSNEEIREANAAIRIIYHMLFNQSLINKSKIKNCIKHLLDLSRYPAILERPDKALSRVLENMIWQTSQPVCPTELILYTLPEPSHCGPIVMSYSSINYPAVAYFVEQLRAAGLPVWNDTEDMIIDHETAQDIGLSALAAGLSDQKCWLQCLNQATVMIACLSDAYRENPGCRAELEYFLTANSEMQPKVLIFVILPPKFRINGWVSRMPNINDAIDFTHKQTFINNLQVLVSRAGSPYGITVADEQLEPLSFDFGSPKGYISIEDLQGLKSSSVFLSSSDSEPSHHSIITQNVEQMFSIGSPRATIPAVSPKQSSDSLTFTGVRSKESTVPGDTEIVPAVPSLNRNLSDSYPHDQYENELLRGSTPLSPKAIDEIQEESMDAAEGPKGESIVSHSSATNRTAAKRTAETSPVTRSEKNAPSADRTEHSRQEIIGLSRDTETHRTDVTVSVIKTVSDLISSAENDMHKRKSANTSANDERPKNVDVEDGHAPKHTSAQDSPDAIQTALESPTIDQSIPPERSSKKEASILESHSLPATGSGSIGKGTVKSSDARTRDTGISPAEPSLNMIQTTSDPMESVRKSMPPDSEMQSVAATLSASGMKEEPRSRDTETRETRSSQAKRSSNIVQTTLGRIESPQKSLPPDPETQSIPATTIASNLKDEMESRNTETRETRNSQVEPSSTVIHVASDPMRTQEKSMLPGPEIQSLPATITGPGLKEEVWSRDTEIHKAGSPQAELSSSMMQVTSDPTKSQHKSLPVDPEVQPLPVTVTGLGSKVDMKLRETNSHETGDSRAIFGSHMIQSTSEPPNTAQQSIPPESTIYAHDVTTNGLDAKEEIRLRGMETSEKGHSQGLRPPTKSEQDDTSNFEVLSHPLATSDVQPDVTERESSKVDGLTHQWMGTVPDKLESDKASTTAPSRELKSAESVTNGVKESCTDVELQQMLVKATPQIDLKISDQVDSKSTVDEPNIIPMIAGKPDVNGRTTHLHMKTVPQSTHGESVETRSNTISTNHIYQIMDKTADATDHSQPLSSPRAQQSTSGKQRTASVQTLPEQQDMKTMGSTESIMNNLPELERGNQSLVYLDTVSHIMRAADQNDLVRPDVCNWTKEQVNEWLTSKGLPNLSDRLCGGIDGKVLSQLVYLRYWAPDYFAKTIRTDLGLGFAQGLQFFAAIEDLKKKP